MLLDDLARMIRELQKADGNVRRKKRKDALRMQLVRVVEITMWRGVLQASNLIDSMTGQLSSLLMELITSIKNGVENDGDREPSVLANLRLHFAKTVALLINSVPLDQRKNLFSPERKKELATLFLFWCPEAVSSMNNHTNRLFVFICHYSVNIFFQTTEPKQWHLCRTESYACSLFCSLLWTYSRKNS